MIECRDLLKTYRVRERKGFLKRSEIRNVSALRGVTFSIPKGQIVGLLGPNGAGKTTLLKILCTLLLSDSGDVQIADTNALYSPKSVRKRIGVVLASDRSLYWKLTGQENLNVYGALYGLSLSDIRKRSLDLLKSVNLFEFVNVPIEKYSTGMRKRLMIARALIHKPEVLILDEPTSGLDIQGKHDLWTLLKQLARTEQVTTLLATHDMEEAEAVPERLLLVHDGVLHADGTPQDLLKAAGRESIIRIDLTERPAPDSGFNANPIVGGFRVEYRTLDPEQVLPTLLRRLPSAIRVERRDPTLAEAFLALTGASLEDET